MNFIISIFLVLFRASLPVKGRQPETLFRHLQPVTAKSISRFRRERAAPNLPDGTMRVINGRPDNVNIYIFNDALDYRKHAYYENTDMQPRLELPYGTYRIYALGNFGSDLGLFDRRAASGPHGYRLFCGPISDRRSGYAVTREEFAVSQALSSLELRLTRPFLQDYFHSFHLVVTLLGRLYRVDDPLQSSAALLLWTDNRLLSTQGQFDFPYEKLTSKKRRHTLTYYQLENLRGTVPAIILPEDRNYRKAPRMATYVNIRICLNQAFYEYKHLNHRTERYFRFQCTPNTAYTYNNDHPRNESRRLPYRQNGSTRFWGTKAGDKRIISIRFRWQNGTAQGVSVIVTEHCDPDNVLSLSFKRTSTEHIIPNGKCSTGLPAMPAEHGRRV